MNVHIGYLDFARVGPIAPEVVATLADAAALLSRDPAAALARLERTAAGARQSAARLLRCAVHEVAFASSTSHGLFAAAAALRADGVVLVRRGEFPANVVPWLRMQELGGLRVRWIDAAHVTPDVVRAHLDGEVRALTVSAVDAFTGHRPALGALKDVLGPDRTLVVDAIQGLGAVPLEVEAADVLASGGQKWLRAGWGAALLMVRDRAADRLHPALGGWSGLRNPFSSLEEARGAVAHTMTNPDLQAVAALGTAIDLVLTTGEKTIGSRIAATLDALLEAAASAGAEVAVADDRAGIARLRHRGRDPARLHDAMTAAGLTTTLRDGWIRLSPHATTPATAAALLTQALHTTDKDTP
ncbi:aminotransferase class V-fold PLP-dependent enzyme [Nonomuraea sp. NPDC050556]|uniref:aminotransferase class V-fold PLP-dependent enzyme n=1 Tax=Nonomuraea sp. NPDC050556 TaxID=3364369 RepID=UPI0037910237